MTEGLPAWRPFPLRDAEPTPLAELPATRGTALVLLASPATHASGWAVRAATRLAARRAAAECRLLLADLDLLRPRIHAELGTDNAEGMTDAFLFGASLQRVACPTDAGFLFVSAGTAVADPARVLTSPRWGALTEGFEGAGAELFLFVPWDLPGRDAILDTADDVILLAERHEVAALALDGTGVGAVLGPADEVGAAVGATDTAPEEVARPEDEVGAAVGATDTAPEEVARPEDEVGAAAGDEIDGYPGYGGDGSPEEPFVTPPDDDPRWDEEGRPPFDSVAAAGAGNRGSRPLLIAGVILLVLLLAVLAAALLGLIRVPGIPTLFAGETVEDARAATGPGATAGQARPATAAESRGATPAAATDSAPGGPSVPSLDRSMAVGSYRDLAEAMGRVEALSSRDETLVVTVSPVEIDGVTWYRILLAPIPRGEGEAAVRSTLASRLGGGDPSGWFERPTPLAFDLGQAATLEAGRVRVGELTEQGIPAYLVEVRPPGPDGPSYRVYAGAYSGPPEAEHLRSLLRARGLEGAPLVPRRGRAPGASPTPPA